MEEEDIKKMLNDEESFSVIFVPFGQINKLKDIFTLFDKIEQHPTRTVRKIGPLELRWSHTDLNEPNKEFLEIVKCKKCPLHGKHCFSIVLWDNTGTPETVENRHELCNPFSLTKLVRIGNEEFIGGF